MIIRDHGSGKRYAKGRFLGKGGFAKCYELKDMDTGEILAGKIVAKSTLTKHRAKEKVRVGSVRDFASHYQHEIDLVST